MSLSVRSAPATWPVNFGAYRRAVVGSPVALLVAGLCATAGSWDPQTAAAAVGAVGGELGLLLVRDREDGWRRHAKTIVSFATTLLVAVLLALSAYEGGDGNLGVGPLLLQLDRNDWLAIGLLVLKSVAQAVIPNADPKFDDDALGDPTAVADGYVAPVVPSTRGTGRVLGDERTETAALPVLTPELIAELADTGRRAKRLASVVPAVPLAITDAPLPAETDLDPTPEQERQRRADEALAQLAVLEPVAEVPVEPAPIPAPSPAPDSSPLRHLIGGPY